MVRVITCGKIRRFPLFRSSRNGHHPASGQDAPSVVVGGHFDHELCN